MASPQGQLKCVFAMPHDPTAPAFAAACGEAGIAVRPFAAEGARISIGDPEANDALLEVARAFPYRT